MTKNLPAKQILSDLFQSALIAVNGRDAVERQLLRMPLEGSVAVIAVGKAAAAMMLGARSQLKDQIQSALIITKAGHADSSLGFPCIEAGHPVPDLNSLKAGVKLLKFLAKIPKETKLLAFISGGASALVEILPETMNLEMLQEMNAWLLGSGLAIDDVNRIRQSVSLIKGGKVLNSVRQSEMTQFLISDVKMDDPEIIGSGLFVASAQNKSVSQKISRTEIPDWLQEHIEEATQPKTEVSLETHIVASNEMACQAIIERAKQADFVVNYHGQTLFGDVFDIAEQLTTELIHAKSGIHIWGGETTLTLPDSPGRGGRNQSLALALAIKLAGTKGMTVLVGATDGSDGPTEDAGAIIDGLTVQRGETYLGQAKEHLQAADAGTFLAEAGDLISTGPTGTNVMDIVIALKE